MSAAVIEGRADDATVSMHAPLDADLPARVVSAVRSVLGDGDGPFPLHEPEIGALEAQYVNDCVTSGWVSTVGPFVDRLEEALGEACGVSHVFATSCGTAALHLALAALGVGEGDEVIVPSLSFVATANAVSYTGAVPHFADADEWTLGLDPRALKKHMAEACVMVGGECRAKASGRRVAAIIVMHAFGHPAEMDALQAVADEWDVPLIEDAAEALGSSYEGKPAGSLSRIAALSFNGNKIATAGGGGAVLTNDAALAERVRYLGSTAKRPHKWEYVHDEMGFNYRMPSLNAALLLAQVERLPDFIKRKRRLAARYAATFCSVQGADFMGQPPGARSNYWLNTIRLAVASQADRDAVLSALIDDGIMARPVWEPLHRLPMYEHCPKADLSMTERLAGQLINLPSSAKLQGLMHD